MAKMEVQVRSCFCCGLSLGTIFIALYTLLLYSLLTGLASWGISDTVANGDNSYYTSCQLEAEGKIRADNRKIVFQGGQTTVIVEDSTSYHCSFGLYAEELKFSKAARYTTLVFNIGLYVLLILASVILLVGLAAYSEWLLLPWLALMVVDIIRGTISTILIFVYSGTLARVATGIFFLGLQFFHISILIIIIAKFQRIYARKRGVILDGDRQRDMRIYPTATLPSNYGYSPSYHRRDVPPQGMPTAGAAYPYSDYSPSQKDYGASYGGGTSTPHRYQHDAAYGPPSTGTYRY